MRITAAAFGRKQDRTLQDGVGSLQFKAENLVEAKLLTLLYKAYLDNYNLTEDDCIDMKIIFDLDRFVKTPKKKVKVKKNEQEAICGK